MNLLQRAVADDNSLAPWGRAADRADLGLALLMSAKEQDGLKWLHLAQADFQQAHDNAGLVQSLRSEAAYFKNTGQAEQARMLYDRASRIAAEATAD